MTLPFADALLEDAAVRALEGFSNVPTDPNEQVAPNPPEDTGNTPAEDFSALQRALYGADFPGAD